MNLMWKQQQNDKYFIPNQIIFVMINVSKVISNLFSYKVRVLCYPKIPGDSQCIGSRPISKRGSSSSPSEAIPATVFPDWEVSESSQKWDRPRRGIVHRWLNFLLKCNLKCNLFKAHHGQ